MEDLRVSRKSLSWGRPLHGTNQRLVILINFENTICQYDELLMETYEREFQSKRPMDLSNRYFPLELNLSRKLRTKLKRLADSLGESFYDQLKPQPGALLALKEMRSLGIDVRIVDTTLSTDRANMNRRIHWINRHLGGAGLSSASQGNEWTERLICTRDKTILRGSFLIDDDPTPQTTGDFQPEWQHVVFDQPYNRVADLAKNKRILNWDLWRTVLGIEDERDQAVKSAKFYQHGSHDSSDIDVFYVLKEMPSLEDCYHLCKGTGEDRNIITLQLPNFQLENQDEVQDEFNLKGVVTDCFKGTPDQCNNGLFLTFKNHKQKFEPNPIVRQVMRYVPLKLMEAVRKILSRSGRHAPPEISKKISDSLRGRDFNLRLEALRSVDYTQNAGMSLDSKKNVAFQLAQMIALIQGTQLFTKSDLISKFPDLENYVKRVEIPDSENFILNAYRDQLLNYLEGITIDHHLDRIMFKIQNPEQIKIWDELKRQCMGSVFHILKERCLYMGPCHSQARDLKNDWSQVENQVEAELNIPMSEMIGIFQDDFKLRWCSPMSMEVSPPVNADDIFNLKDFQNWFFILKRDETNRVHVVAKRHRFTGDFVVE
eukprot:TRINITY_DN3071_c1_g1_i1.p1 TRINITY_DN3071_c1_g1~~TRINITY_DN3071_c1_g1_i1.p1  ORF type:complete len:600 (+),score=231.34 TRINITY_DN3071_c1_g1_i1:6-1805(+)